MSSETKERKGKIVLLTPVEAVQADRQRGQESLTDAGRRVLKRLAREITLSGGRQVEIQVDKDYTTSEGYGLTDLDIRIIKAEADCAGWTVARFEPNFVGEGYGEGSWWSIEVVPQMPKVRSSK